MSISSVEVGMPCLAASANTEAFPEVVIDKPTSKTSDRNIFILD